MKQTAVAQATSGIFGAPVLGQQAFTVISAWRDSIKVGLPDEVTAPFGGADFPFVFGPNDGTRKSIRHLTEDEYEQKLKAIKKYNNPDLHCINGKIWIESLGTVDFITALTFVFQAFADIYEDVDGKSATVPILWGLKLTDLQEKLDDMVMGGVPVDISYLRTNTKDAQRDIDLSRIFSKMCDFDPSLIFGAKGRYSEKENKVYLNDGNHGSIIAAVHGLRTIPVAFSPKDLAWQDSNQFLALGKDVLPLTDYDIYKNEVARARAMKESNLDPKKEDIPSYNLYTTLIKYGITLVPELKDNPGPKQSKHTAHFQKHFKEYCKYVKDTKGAEWLDTRWFEAALKTVVFAWPGSEVDHAPVWGLIEFYRSQYPSRSKNPIPDSLITNVAHVLAKKWSSSKQVWPEVNKAIQKQYHKGSKSKGWTGWKDHRFTASGNRGLMIAAAILTVINNREDWIRKQPGRNKGFDLKLVAITSTSGQLFEMDMPYSSKETGSKNHSAFIATEPVPGAIRGLNVSSTEDDEDTDDIDSAISEFEDAIEQ